MSAALGATGDADVFEWTVLPAESGERLDRFLAHHAAGRSRSLLQRHIELGAVLVDGASPRRGAKTALAPGAKVSYRPPPPEPSALEPEALPLSIVFEDEHLLVVDKAADVVVHPALGHRTGTLVNALLHHVRDLAAGEAARPGIVHRLDKGTTGLLVVAKTEAAHASLVALFKAREVTKTYLLYTLGVPRPPSGTFDTLHGRHPRDRKRFSTRVTEGRRAVTHYAVVRSFVGAARVEARIETGRTHQIRVHFADAGTPLIGDALYGSRRTRRVIDPRIARVARSFPRPALHAHRLSFRHPITAEALDLEAAIPEDLLTLEASLEALE